MGLHTLADYERRAREIISDSAWVYYDYGRERRWCLEDSVKAFSRYRIRSQVLQDVSKRSLATTVLGQPLKYPICIAPTALHTFAHRGAEKETIKGAEAAETLMVMSASSSFPIEDVAAAAPNSHRWMQIYPNVDQELTLSFIRRSESLGFKALVVTVDSPVRGLDSRISEAFSHPDLVNNPDARMAALEVDIPSSREALERGDHKLYGYVREMLYNPKSTWEYIRWIRSKTTLPVVCKGILTYESAQAAANAGVDGILVSAHGGRQLDGAPAPIDALAEVVDAVRGSDVEVYMDGGVRTGTDVFKALGRGARAVFVGRPILWGLACQGAEGVENVLSILRSQLSDVLGLSGCTSPNTIPEGTVVHESYYHRQPNWRRDKSKL
nr:2-Hydroxyacid oxidase 1-like [Lytechinus pictus]